jgi:hypothetical protein
MTKLIGELLFAMASTLIKGWANSFVQKVGGWLDTKVHGRRMKIVVGVLLGLAAYVLIPICAGLLGL